jgi:two-component system KDP operon response regulator KdpE
MVVAGRVIVAAGRGPICAASWAATSSGVRTPSPPVRVAATAALATPAASTVGALTVDPAARTAQLDGRPLELTAKEFDLLHFLAERAGQVVTKRELLAEVWRQPYGGADKTVDVHLSWLRRKLGETAQEPRFLHTVRGVGVRLEDSGSTP